MTDSEDEKRLEKTEKEAERFANKKRRAGNRATGKKLRRCWSEGIGRREPDASGGSGLPATVPPARPRVLGPCFKCATWGHLAANCPAKNRVAYPFCQPVISTAKLSNDLLSGGITVYNEQNVQKNSVFVLLK